MDALRKNTLVSFFSLFTSMGTLLCCALPALLVSLGMGAAMVGLVTTFPGLVTLSEYKGWVFVISFGMLALSSYFQYQARFLPCPIDPVQAKACTSARAWSKWITIFSIIVWFIGASVAFGLPFLTRVLE